MGTLIKNGVAYGGGSSGTSDYTDLSNKPSIENVTLSGNKSASDLGLAKTSDLSNFITKSVNDLVNYYLKSETYSKAEVDAIVTAIKNSRFEVVSSLPTTNIKTNVIYLVPSADPQTSNAKDEYINLDGTTAGWEKIGSTSVDLSGYVTDTELNTALANYTTTTDLTTLLAGKQDKIQVTTMPTASATTMNRIYQFMGTTDSTYTHGYFYETKESSGNYSWQQVNVQPSGGGGGGSYTAGEGIDITNDVISTKQSEEGDIDEIIDVYPQAGNLVSIVNAFNKGDIYSTEEKMIGQWTDGKPLYQKTFVQSISVAVGDTAYVGDLSGLNIDFGTVSEYVMIDTNGYATALTHFDVWLRVPQNNIGVTNKSTQAKVGQMYVTIQYTKTTDVAISIGEATEYSTDEKIVGTWIDGKPIYQCTYNVGTLNLGTTWSSSTLDFTVDRLINAIGCGESIDNNNIDAGAVVFPVRGVNMYTYDLSVKASKENNKFVIYSYAGNIQKILNAYLTVQYTKATT